MFALATYHFFTGDMKLFFFLKGRDEIVENINGKGSLGLVMDPEKNELGVENMGSN
jgi:hypothetical protein